MNDLGVLDEAKQTNYSAFKAGISARCGLNKTQVRVMIDFINLILTVH